MDDDVSFYSVRLPLFLFFSTPVQHPEKQDVVDDPFFAAEAESPAGSRSSTLSTEQVDTLGPDVSMPVEDENSSLFDRVAGAPLTLWTIPEISSVGFTEEMALAEGMKKASEGGSL